ncbi:unnamed protein product [Porites evermanni]|uniref:Tubulin-folding cofactor D C-terminal domain-containing protein n=1 Tax=Porites evermanni TaxID=104178 RepID=A0ABN8RJB2_9CNID|nr:unnamed protein product [Porites evermanni]
MKQIGTISDHLILWNSISEESHRSIGHFELSLEAGSVLFPITAWDLIKYKEIILSASLICCFVDFVYFFLSCQNVMYCLVQQASEKIDRTRAHAGEIFLRLLYMDNPCLPHVPHHRELLEIFPRKDCLEINWSAPSECFPRITKLLGLPSYRDPINWSAPSECFPRITKLLGLPSYRDPVLLGLTVSVGGLTESLVSKRYITSHSILVVMLSNQPDEKEMTAFGETLLKMYRNNQKNDRQVKFPLFKMLDMLLSNGCFDMFAKEESHPFPQALCDLTKKEIFKLGDAKKLITSITVFCGLLQFPGVTRTKSFQQLTIFLCHKYPQVRKTTADQLYSAALTFDDIIPGEKLDDVLAILSETSWDAKIEDLRVTRNNLCDILGIPRPVLKSTGRKAAVSEKKDELDSYKG